MMGCGWETAKLGELVNFKTGKLDSNAAVSDGEYPFFTCSQETLRTNTYSFDTECVLLAGNNANGIYPLKYFHGKFDAYQRTYVVTTRDADRLATRFLYYALRPKLGEFRSLSTGAATKFLTLTILKDTAIPVPPLSVQRRIAEILSAYDELIENNQRRIRILEEMARALYRGWFVECRFPGHAKVSRVASALGDIPKGWKVRKLGEILELRYGKALKQEDRQEGVVPVYGSSGVVGMHDVALVSGPGIVVGRKGNVGSVFWSDQSFYPIDTVYFVVSELPLRFLYHDLLAKTFLNSDAAVPGLNRAQAYSMEALVPTPDLITRFNEIADDFGKHTSLLQRQCEKLRAMRDLALPRLMGAERFCG